MTTISDGAKLVTATDLLSRADDGYRYELVHGQLVRDRVPATGLPDGCFDGAPDLAVEVLSPDDRLIDVESKIRDYFDAGCRQVWVIAPKVDTVSIYRSRKDIQILTEQDTLLGKDFLLGFECSMADLFR